MRINLIPLLCSMSLISPNHFFPIFARGLFAKLLDKALTDQSSKRQKLATTLCMLCNFLCSCCRLLTFFQNKLFLLLFFTSHQQYLSHVRTRLPGLNQYYAEYKVSCSKKKNLSGTLSMCWTVWIQMMTHILLVLIWIQCV